MRAAAAAAQASVMLAPSTVERVSHCLPIPQPWNNDVRQSWVSLLGAGRAAVPVLEALDQAGIVSGLIPEWEAVRSLPQPNPMHEFTVDRHLVETAVHAGQRARDVARPDLLLVGAFLHDIGKGRYAFLGDFVASMNKGPVKLEFGKEEGAEMAPLFRLAGGYDDMCKEEGAELRALFTLAGRYEDRWM